MVLLSRRSGRVAWGVRYAPGRLSQQLAVAIIAFAAGLGASLAQGENWPNWRGPSGLGVARTSRAPQTWSPQDNIRWRVELPEPGNSTPVVWADRIFVTQPVREGNRRTLACFNRRDGQLLWQSGVVYADKDRTHETNHYCSASPVTDGERVIAWFGSAGLVCYDFAGRELWRRDLGKQEHDWGYAGSPILHGELCILHFGPGNREFLIAVDKRTGETAWQVDALPPGPDGDLVETGQGTGNARSNPEKQTRADILRGSWTTPLVIRAANRDELIVTWPERVVAYDPRTGKELWTCGGLGALVYASPMYGDGIVVALGGYHGASLAVRPGGSGDVTDTHRLWHTPKSKLWLGTGVVRDKHLYVITMEGIVQCLELATGDVVWEKRQAGKSDNNATWASIILIGDRLYAINQSADTFVLRASPTYEQLAINSVDEPTNSSIAVAGDDLLIRTHKHLWCIGNQASK